MNQGCAWNEIMFHVLMIKFNITVIIISIYTDRWRSGWNWSGKRADNDCLSAHLQFFFVVFQAKISDFNLLTVHENVKNIFEPKFIVQKQYFYLNTHSIYAAGKKNFSPNKTVQTSNEREINEESKNNNNINPHKWRIFATVI